MGGNILKYLFNSLLTILIQILFINNINYWGLINPKIYPIFLLFLPRNIKPVYLMFIGLVFGFIVDLFSQTMGIGMASCVFLALMRPYLFSFLFNKREDDDFEYKWNFYDTKFIFRFLFITLFIFHLTYFFIELGELSNVFYILLKSLLSTALAVIIYIIYYLLFAKSKASK